MSNTSTTTLWVMPLDSSELLLIRILRSFRSTLINYIPCSMKEKMEASNQRTHWILSRLFMEASWTLSQDIMSSMDSRTHKNFNLILQPWWTGSKIMMGFKSLALIKLSKFKILKSQWLNSFNLATWSKTCKWIWKPVLIVWDSNISNFKKLMISTNLWRRISLFIMISLSSKN